MLRALLILLVLPPYIVLGSMIGYPIARLLGGPAILWALGRFGARVLLLLAGVGYTVDNLERLGDVRNTVVMPNHTSNLDAAVLALALKVEFKAVVKTELFRIPFFGSCLRYAGFIEVDRKDKAQSQPAIAAAVEALKKGECFLIFPEGTRTRTGDLGDFKKGAFVVAVEARSRIVPVAILGGYERLPPGRLSVRPGTIHVRLLDPIDAGGYSYETRDALVSAVRGRIATALATG